jgi:hypothetical protein
MDGHAILSQPQRGTMRASEVSYWVTDCTDHRMVSEQSSSSQRGMKFAAHSTDVKSTPFYMEAEINSPMIDLQAGENHGMDTNGCRRARIARCVASPVPM